jgi:1,4-dihydroxy-2-naphthoate octaprenyltransferase
MNLLRFWIQNARPKALPQSILPAVLAFCMALRHDGFSLWLGLAAICGVVAGHLGMNLFDDYFDYKVKGSEFRDAMARKGFRARIAKCAYITSGQTGLRQLLCAGLVFGAVAFCLGFIIFIFRGMPILWLALIAAALGLSYSGWPLRLSYHGLGEILIAIKFGPLMMAGVYFSTCGQLDGALLFVSVPVGLLVANIVYTHAIMDYEPDREAGKQTLAVLLKSKTLMLVALALFLFIAYASIPYGVATGYLSPLYLLTLLTLPMAIALFYLMTAFVRHPEKQFTPRIWMGPMGNWERTKAIGIDWFMIRWMLSRNLLSVFCLILIAVSLVAELNRIS